MALSLHLTPLFSFFIPSSHPPIMSTELPKILPLVPLYDKVLLPSIVTKIVLDGNEAKSLLRKLENNDHTFIFCTPYGKTDKDNNGGPGSSLCQIGCVANVLDVDTSISYNTVFLVQGVCRAQIQDIHGQDLNEDALFDSTVEPLWASMKDSEYGLWAKVIRQLCVDFIGKMQMIGVASSVLSPFQKRLNQLEDQQQAATTSSPPSMQLMDMAHFLLCMTEASFNEKWAVLILTDASGILHEIQTIVTRHMQVKKLEETGNYRQFAWLFAFWMLILTPIVLSVGASWIQTNATTKWRKVGQKTPGILSTTAGKHSISNRALMKHNTHWS